MLAKTLRLPRLMLALTFSIGAVAVMRVPVESRPAPGERGFWCDRNSVVPTTMYQNYAGEQEPWIRWQSNRLDQIGYDRITRCEIVSGRLENYRQQGRLNFITVARMNGENVICTANQVNSRCDQLILTLRRDADPIESLMTFLDWREGVAGQPSLWESLPSEDLYINVGERLREQQGQVQPNPQPRIEREPDLNPTPRQPEREQSTPRRPRDL